MQKRGVEAATGLGPRRQEVGGGALSDQARPGARPEPHLFFLSFLFFVIDLFCLRANEPAGGAGGRLKQSPR